MPTTLQNPLVDTDWVDIIDSLEAEKCVIFLGSGVYHSPGGQNLETELGQWLDVEQPHHPMIQVYNDDGFFLFRNARKHKRKVITQIKNFYNQPFPETSARFAQLAQMPFSIIVSLMPDNILARTFDELGLNYQPDFYFRNRKYPEFFEKPAKNKPLIYNLLGNIEEPESLVLTHSDFFDYLESVFLARSMHPDLREELESAERYIFLGLPYEKWYFQLLLRVLSMNSDKLKDVERLALEEFQNPKLQTLYTEEFKINFFPSNPELFIANLYQACQSAGVLKKLPSPDPTLAQVEERSPAALEELIAKADTESAFMHLKVFLDRRKPRSYALANDLVVLHNQYNLLRQRELRGTIYPQDVPVENAQIVERLLGLIEKAEGLG
ncbi:SIR2 family protein [Haliscomenobacter hydrossis]|uniref:Effector-associated domain-containing protein n=1 Tax=Haliscomenobacter hydrossis (strain ATCC 27775 / DSM 1100 / LMG 10767 / O) TaxID=760192 RepID=F4KPS5_HALH1|nr:SIR2 family protein [Haliscomenobacter hydrossis]AEE52175.1 hypothetical protein Halhy_4331 [Haliscomenobacter hydrossis DSM 1100]